MKKLTLRAKLTILNVALLILMCIVLTISINSSAKSMVAKIAFIPIQPGLSGATIYDKTGHTIMDSFPSTDVLNNAIAVDQFLDTTYIYLAIIVLMGGLATFFLIKNQVKPLEKLTSDIQNLTSCNLNSQLNIKHNSYEIHNLAQAFNKMTSNLQLSFEKQKRFSIMSAHEFRTPLAVLKTKLQVFKMKKEHQENDYQALIEIFSLNIERLTSVIDCLLALTNDEKTTMDDVVNLDDIMLSVERDLQFNLAEKSISLVKNIDSFEFLGNKTLISRAIFNLVENSIRYNSSGGEIIISAEKTDCEYYISVKDNGIGIPDDAKTRIFEPFYTVDKSRSRAFGGAGLGLSLVHDIVSKHGGNIVIVDNFPCGSNFVITLPRQ